MTSEIDKQIADETQGARKYRKDAREARTLRERRIYASMSRDEAGHARKLVGIRRARRRSLSSRMIRDY